VSVDETLETQNSKLITKMVLVVEYDGANYCGFQFQADASTIQGELEKALFRLTGENTRIVGASRTDSGVHARYQVVSLRTSSDLEPKIYIRALNHFLPRDIAVKAAYKVNRDFNVQRQAVSRTYQYRILNSGVRDPLRRGYTFQVQGQLAVEAMNQAARLLVGERDMASFVTDFSQSVIRSTVREVFAAQVEQRKDLVVFNITAKSFLPHQVRNTVGTLIRVGLNKIDIKEFETILEAKRPGLAGPTVPAWGLYLMQVNYPRPLGEYYDEDL
jgi:tRNA pseudouridine38-40 synthase